MRKLLFQRWCSKAVSGIRCSPERETVSQELFDHMEDLYQTLTAEGVDPKEAQHRAVAAMGSAEELAPQLAAIHRPFWGMLELFCRRALVILAFITLLSFGFFVLENFFFDPMLQEFDPDAGLSLSGNLRQTGIIEADAMASSDGYSISIDRVSLWERSQDSDCRYYCNIQIKVFNPLPWADVPEFSGWYWAEDSLGNYYYSSNEDSSGKESSIQATDYRTGFFTTVQDLWLSPWVSQEAQWIQLHYDRSGRDIVLYIALSGGEQP